LCCPELPSSSFFQVITADPSAGPDRPSLIID
jgi:hypothetical protein